MMMMMMMMTQAAAASNHVLLCLQWPLLSYLDRALRRGDPAPKPHM
jgi:hypothetical protein